MQQVTLLIGIVGSVLALILRPPRALVAYVAVLVWYPSYLTVQVGKADFSAGRIVIVFLFLRCLLSNRLRAEFTWSRLDTWVTLSVVVYVGMYFLTRPFSLALENRSGFLMTTWTTYMVARLIITNRKSLAGFVKGVGLILAPLAILGVVESVTHRYFFLHLKVFRAWDTILEDPTQIPLKWGLFGRAVGPFSHPIMFGMCFAMFLPLVWALRRERGYWGHLAYAVSAALVAGALSSMSSNAWMAAIFAVLILSIERHKGWVKPLLKGLAAGCVLVELVSNRRFYHVLLQYANPVSGTWWQRARLVDCAIETVGEWWLLGYKGRDPGWGRKMGMGHTDVNNEFILAGVNYGIWGVFALCAVLVSAMRGLIQLHRATDDAVLRSWAWAFATTIVVWIISFQGVSLFGQNIDLFYCLLGCIGSLAGFPTQRRTARAQVQVCARRQLVHQSSIA